MGEKTETGRFMKKIRVVLLFGGQSAEHDVSIQSAKNVYAALDKEKYEVTPIYISKKGTWHDISISQLSSPTLVISSDSEKSLITENTKNNVILNLVQDHRQGTSEMSNSAQHDMVVFPLLHGPMGEDGTIQGMLKTLGIPFVGSDVLGSAVGMDKDVMKRLLRDAGIPIGKFLVLRRSSVIPVKTGIQAKEMVEWIPDRVGDDKLTIDQIIEDFGLPLFVKPANLGSSVGVSKAHDRAELEQAITEAFTHDRKIIIEEFIKGREIECAVLGNDDPKASIAGEIIPTHEFYDYDAKYLDENGAKLQIPADISEETLKEVQRLAIKTFQVLEARGLSRVDFFLTEEGMLYVNEINTMPGFTKISMYPKLWEASGVVYSELIDELIQLALQAK